MDWINLAVIAAREPHMTYDERKALLAEVRQGASRRGMKTEDLLFMPDKKFFRRRGLPDYIYQPYDVHGRLLKDEGGRPIDADAYIAYLRGVLPHKYQATKDWNRYQEHLRSYRGGQQAERVFG